MRKSYLLVLMIMMLFTGIITTAQAQVTLIPDPKFEQALIDLGLDSGPVDGSIPRANISNVTAIDVANRNITDLTGIQDFVSLTRLFCNTNQLTKLDITKNKNLTGLLCDRNQLTALDVTKNTQLVSLLCSNNHITTLDITKNTGLKNLGCDDNLLKELDVSKNTALTSIGCGNNLLTSLNVTNNLTLTSFGCDNNLLTSLDVSKNIDLTSFGCSNNKLTGIDVSKNSLLYSFECFNNLFTSLDVTKNPNLTTLNCAGNKLTSLDITDNPAIIYLRCQNNQLKCLDIATNTAVTELRCNNNLLTCLNLKNRNNSSIAIMDATNNNPLKCIQADDPITAASYIGWIKDTPAQYQLFCSPAIISFSPTATCPGQPVTIIGCNFSDVSAVSFGAVQASSFSISNANTITAIVASGAAGNVKVVTTGGEASLAGFSMTTLSVPGAIQIITSANDICPYENVIFTAIPVNPGTNPFYQWKLNGTNTGDNSLTYSNSNFTNNDQVYCIMNSYKTCPASETVHSDTIIMKVKSVPEIIINPSNPSVSQGNAIQLNALVTGSVSGFLWKPSNGINNPSVINPVANPDNTTEYTLQVTAANNCIAEKKVTITVFKNIHIPNSFSPNGDGRNDLFRIPPGTFFKMELLLVYDRYGNEIFKTTDINKGWDGYYKGVKSPQGSYTYVIKGVGLKAAFVLQGSFLLIR